jgi:2,4-dienoyl-CoA reductase-like NADH-dependent reductase (Old Yellow Enzyme family)
VEFAKRAKALGIDLIDVSSGGNVPDQQIVLGPGYQVPFSSAIRNQAGIATTAVGLISDAVQAEQIVAHGHADSVSLARALRRDGVAQPVQARRGVAPRALIFGTVARTVARPGGEMRDASSASGLRPGKGA